MGSHYQAEVSLKKLKYKFDNYSMAYENIRQQQHAVKPDYIEVLPGVMPKVIGKVCKMSKTPIIAGGLISDKESVMAALSAGAIAVSSTNHEVWKM